MLANTVKLLTGTILNTGNKQKQTNKLTQLPLCPSKFGGRIADGVLSGQVIRT